MVDGSTIVSLIASGTEIVCALGLRDRLVGISHECDFPAGLIGLPVLSRPKLNPKKPGHEIDHRVRELVRNGLSVYEVDAQRIEELAPDLIVTQDHCEVCAVSLKDVEEATCSMTLKKTRICSLHPSTLDDVCIDFQKVADSAEVSARGHQLVSIFSETLNVIRSKTQSLGPKPRVACLEWLSPPMLAAGWMSELVNIAGGEPLVVDETKAFTCIEWQELVALDPDMVVVMPCGYSIEQSLEEMRNKSMQTELRRLRALREEAIYVVDGNAYFNRPGPRLAASAEILASLFHPQAFPGVQTRYRDSVVSWA